MKTRRIGSLDVSLVGLGCNNFGRRIDAEETRAVVNTAIDEGITLFDTADVYGQGASEELLGKALGTRRDAVIIATKFGQPMGERRGASPEWIRQAVEDSLRRLGTDRIDLYQLHRPDPEVPVAETLGALGDLVDAGKVREIGNSNFSAAQIREADAASAAGNLPRFASAQNQWSLLTPDPEADVVPACQELGLGILPYFPLESGVLTGKYRRGEEPPPGTRLAPKPDVRNAGGTAQGPLAENSGARQQFGEEQAQRFLTDDKLATVERLVSWVEERDHSLLELAFSWLAAQETCASVIAGASTPDQVRSNAAAVAWELSADERTDVAGLTGRS